MFITLSCLTNFYNIYYTTLNILSHSTKSSSLSLDNGGCGGGGGGIKCILLSICFALLVYPKNGVPYGGGGGSKALESAFSPILVFRIKKNKITSVDVFIVYMSTLFRCCISNGQACKICSSTFSYFSLTIERYKIVFICKPQSK